MFFKQHKCSIPCGKLNQFWNNKHYGSFRWKNNCDTKYDSKILSLPLNRLEELKK